MASPTVRRGINHSAPGFSARLRLPLFTRRCGAWVVEVSLLAASVLVPYNLGVQVQNRYTGEAVPLNPVLVTAESAIAQTLALPMSTAQRTVAPLTNLFWSGALVTPLLWTGLNLYLLSRTGKTIVKRWWGVQVATAEGAPPGLARILLREGVGHWGLPLGVAYSIWRYTGAFPDLTILITLSGLTLVGSWISARFHPQRRGWHDCLAGTFVVDVLQPWRGAGRFHPVYPLDRNVPHRLERSPHWTDEDRAIAAIVLTPESTIWQRQGLWLWMRQHPGLTLLTVSLSSMALVLGTFVGTQIYVQSQANQREFKQQDNQVFLSLVSKLSPTEAKSPDERRGAILALGTVKDARAIPLLVDLLGQEDAPVLIDAIQQALVTTGTAALPPLHRLNQSLRNDLEALKGSHQTEQNLLALRQRATQRAIAKLLTLYTGQLNGLDLGRVHLGQRTTGPAQFTLVLDQADLSGIQLRGAILTNARLQNARFFGPGPDGRLGTFDDAIADLSGADLRDANLSGATLTSVSLNRTNLIRSTLVKAHLGNARMSGANLSSAKLNRADFRQAILENASFTGADLGEANFSQANLQAARLGQSSALGTQFQLANLVQSDWQGADLSGADFSRANLESANFRAARLTGTILTNAQLQNASFRDADLTTVDLRGANLEGADFQGAIFVAKTPVPADQFIRKPPSAAPSGLLTGVNFSKARNLSSNQLAYLCTQGVQHPQCR